MRVALYARVSTDEQARHGLSIDTQLANLREWAEKNGHTIVGEYVDAGVSGKKPYSKRPALSAFFADLEHIKVDALVFTKLDRFFRSVKLYYQAIAVMERHKVAWQAVQEDYETVTSSGRFKVNIMLSVAESEADRTSERIKVINDAKKARHEPLSGMMPVGYRIDGKSIVPDENRVEAVKTLFKTYALTGSKRIAIDTVEQEFGFRFGYKAAGDMLVNRSYLGEFYGIPGYAPPILTNDEWNAAQAARIHYTKKPKQHTYIFGGLTRCPVCGNTFKGGTPLGKNPMYRCHKHAVKECTNKVCMKEAAIERFLLDNVEEAFPAYAISVKLKGDPAKKEAALKRRAAKLQDLYMLDMISLEDLSQQKKEIDAELAAITTRPAITAAQINAVLGKGWQALYGGLDKMGKRMFWRTIIREIRIYPDRHMEFDFR